MISLTTIARFYSKVLNESPLAQSSRDYLYERGFTKDTLDTFCIGYSPEPIIDYIALDALKYSDLLNLEEVKHLFKLENGAYSDRFRGRITFPFTSSAGNVLGFAARSIGGELPKYLNSSESTAYSKSRCLFGLSQAHESIFDSNFAILCEGYTDAMAFHQAGKHEAVACGGTHATSYQLSLIARYTKNLLLAFDADDAGDSVTQKTLHLATSMGFNTKILKMDRGKDPAESLLKG